MFIKISKTTPVLPLFVDDALTEKQETQLLAKCPIIDLNFIEHKEQITHFLILLFAYYFDLSSDNINAEHSLVDDIERQIWAKELGVDVDDVTYGKLFCGKGEDGNAIGGLEDRGMILATFFMLDFADLIGLKETEEKSEATFEADDDEFGSYYDCENINELATLIFLVCEKLTLVKNTKSS